MPNIEKIIGRAYEIEKLEKAYHSKRAEFITVYGRRRIGKTYLIRKFFSKKDCLFFQTTGLYAATAKTQLKEVVKEIQTTFLPAYAKLESPKNWMDAFQILTQIILQQNDQRKIILFFDEFPWMAIRSSKLLQALEYYWNRHWSNIPHLKLIICGSASSWIITHIIQNKGGLHNRVTLRLPMEPFNLAETQAFLKYNGVKYDHYQTLQTYLCIGGIPYYLNMLDSGFSAVQNINRICFQKRGGLFDEFDLLFSSLFKNSEYYEQLIKIIATQRNGVSRTDIETRVQYKGGPLSKRLLELEQVGFIVSFMQWDRSKKGRYYKIVDEYTLFYLTWISPSSKEKIKKTLTNKYWEEISQTQAWISWAGYAFEAVCFKHLNQIRRALHIPDGTAAYTWKYVAPKFSAEEQGCQIDLVFDRQDQIINICEITYSKTPYIIDKEETKILLKKVSVYRNLTKTNKLIFISFVATFGLKPSIHSKNLISSIATLADLFQESE